MKTVTLNFRDARVERPETSMVCLAALKMGERFFPINYSKRHDSFGDFDFLDIGDNPVNRDVVYWIPEKELLRTLFGRLQDETNGGNDEITVL